MPEAIVLMGPPTSGKSSFATLIAEVTHAQIIRGKDIVPELTDKYGSFRNLIPDELFIPRLKLILDKLVNEKVVFDNIPRTSAQALEIVKWATSLTVIQLSLTENEVLERAKSRLVCPTCGESYHPQLKPSKSAGICDKDLQSLMRRSGDFDENTVRKGYRQYQQVEENLLQVLQSFATVYPVTTSGTVQEVFLRIKDNLLPYL